MAASATGSPGGHDLDALGLLALGSGAQTRFGDVEVTAALRGLKARAALNDLPSAELGLELQLLGGRPPDYFAPVEIARLAEQQKQLLFTGSVLSAKPAAGRVELSLASMPEMNERAMPAFSAWMVSAPEITHGMLRSAGMQESQLNIEGLDQLPVESFEVIAPVQGLQVPERTALDDVYFLPADAARAGVDRLGVVQPLASSFTAADCHAVTFVTARRMFDAEVQALSRIDVALAWLSVQARYGLAVWPDASARSYSRAASRSSVRRGDLVWVRGLASTRQWMRSPVFVAQAQSLDLQSGHHAGAVQLRLLSLQERQAALALRRAGSDTEPLQSITALWEALEFYVAKVELPELFSPAQLRTLRKAVPKDLPQPLRTRAIEAINRLNEPALMTRLRVASERDGVMLSKAEWDLLTRLRRVRNEAVHGASQTTATAWQIDLGVSIVARVLLHRAYRRRLELDHTADGGD
jgi:hypothetical protein